MPNENNRPTGQVPVEELFDQAKPLLPSVVRAAFYHYHSSATADDIERCCNRLLFKLWRDDYQILCSFRQEASLRTYLLKIAYHEAVAFLREKKKNAPLEELSPEMIEQLPQQEEHLLHGERVQLLEKAVKQLSKQDNDLYDLVYRKELPVKEIAQRLGGNTEAIWQRISRLRKRLKSLTEKNDFSCQDFPVCISTFVKQVKSFERC